MSDDGWDCFGDGDEENQSLDSQSLIEQSELTSTHLPIVGGILASEHPFFTESKLWPTNEVDSDPKRTLSFICDVIRNDFKRFVTDRKLWNGLGCVTAETALMRLVKDMLKGSVQEKLESSREFFDISQVKLDSNEGWTDPMSLSLVYRETERQFLLSACANFEPCGEIQHTLTLCFVDFPISYSTTDHSFMRRTELEPISRPPRKQCSIALGTLDAMIVVSGRLEDGASRWELPYLPEVVGMMVFLLEDALDVPTTRLAAKHTSHKTKSKIHSSSTSTLIPQYPGKVVQIPTVDCAELSMAVFYAEYLHVGKPVIVKGHLQHTHWKGMEIFSDLNEMKRRYGHRTVPIEGLKKGIEIETTANETTRENIRERNTTGNINTRHNANANSTVHTDTGPENHTQSTSGSGKLHTVLFADFIDLYLMPSEKWCNDRDIDNHVTGDTECKEPRIGYISQHNLFQQIRQMQDMFSVPLYTNLGNLKMVNAWCGTVGTVTALHTDEDNNFLAQISGNKYIKIFSPTQTKFLYARAHPRATAENPLNNFSPLDIRSPDLESYPLYEDALAMHAVLEPGDMLFLPKSWWHYVESMSTSFSVNFWF
eukprot:CFRG5311T1